MKNLHNLRQKAINFIHSVWGKDCLNNPELDIDTENFERIAKIAFKDITINKHSVKNPFMFRIGGQSGSGKTTQLMPSIQSIIGKKDNNFINISIRLFSKYHPHYNDLLNQYGEGMIREKTNGFALLLIFRITELLIQNKYNILFEMTILDNDFEYYLSKLAKINKYNIHFHVLSVPKNKSNSWIEKRKNNSKTEGNRIVLKTSSDFFYDILSITFPKMINYHFWNKNDMIFLWTGFLNFPIEYGKIYKNKKFLKLFEKYRNYEDFEDKDEKELLNNKIIWFEKYYV